MEHGTLTQEKREAAIMWNKTKDQYKIFGIKSKDDYGTNNSKRRIVSISSCHKADDGTYIFIGTSRLHGTVRDTKS